MELQIPVYKVTMWNFSLEYWSNLWKYFSTVSSFISYAVRNNKNKQSFIIGF